MAFIESHLHRLVLDHDCLVIPGLGGFVCNEQPARFDAAANELVPPRRAIQFNERLLHNDGVLAHAVSVAEGMPYAEALQAVEEEAAQLRATLHRQRSVVLQRFGRLFIGENGATQFMAEAELERLLDGFGLQRIPLKPLVRKEAQEVPVIPLPHSTRWPRIAAAIGIPLVAGSMWWMSNAEEVDALSLLPKWGAPAVAAAYAPMPVVALPEAALTESGYAAVLELEGEALVRFDFTAGQPSPDGVRIWVGAEANSAAEVEATPAAVTMATSAFALVAGAFSKESNAQGHAADLAQTGLQPEIHRLGSLHFVTVGLFQREGDARAALSAIRGAGHDAVWLKQL